MQVLWSEQHQAVVWRGEPTEIEALAARAPVQRVREDVAALRNPRFDLLAAVAQQGFPVYMPMADYSWPHHFSINGPYKRQRDMARWLVSHRRTHNLSEIGTGKTLGMLWAADYLREKGAVKRVLVIAPATTLGPVWLDTAGLHFVGRFNARICGAGMSKRQRDEVLRDPDVNMVVANFEAIRGSSFHDFLAAGFDLLMVDESHKLRHRTAAQTKAVHKLAQAIPVVWLATGTPTPQSPTDAWAQQWVLLGKMPVSYASFEALTMRKVSQYKRVPVSGAHQHVFQLMQPAIRVLRDECIEIPPLRYLPLQVELTQAQQKLLHDLKRTMREKVSAGLELTAVHEGALRLKLLQIMSGTVYVTDAEGGRTVHEVGAAPRYERIMDTIEGCPRKVLVFAAWRHAVEKIAAMCAVAGIPAAMVHGDVGHRERDEIFRKFQTTPDVKVIVADPATMAHGLTLTEADTIIWATPHDSSAVYAQANGRITRPGQKHKQTVYHVVGSKLEADIFERLQRNQNLQDLVMRYLGDEE